MLLKLPGELRTSIYHYVLSYSYLTLRSENYVSGSSPGHRTRPYEWVSSVIQDERPSLSLLAVSKQLYREASPLLYQNTFDLSMPPADALAFLQSRPSWALPYISRICLLYLKPDRAMNICAWRQLCKLLRSTLQLKELSLYCDAPFWEEEAWQEWHDIGEVEWVRQLAKIQGLQMLTIEMYPEYYETMLGEGDDEPADHLETHLKTTMLGEGGKLYGWRQFYSGVL